MGQQGVLLCLVETMDFINKQNGLPLLLRSEPLCTFNTFTNCGNACQYGIDGKKMGSCGVGNDPGEGGLARAWRPVKDQAGKLVCLNRTTE